MAISSAVSSAAAVSALHSNGMAAARSSAFSRELIFRVELSLQCYKKLQDLVVVLTIAINYTT